jgi:cell division septation protein DedD
MSYLKIFSVLGLLLLPTPGVAQELERVEELALSGQAEAARDILSSWWESTFEDATRIDRQKALWLRGLLTVDPDLAELDFQRLVVEYPGGPFTAEALVRLGGASEARNDLDGAERHFRTLLRDYPGSRYQTLARAWLDSRITRAPGAPSVADPGTGAESPPARELPPARSATTIPPAATPTTPPPEATPSGSGSFAVQLGAFSSEARALTLSRVATDAGFAVRVVQVEGSGLFRVRMGRYTGEAEAIAEMARVVERGFEATVVRNADREGA